LFKKIQTYVNKKNLLVVFVVGITLMLVSNFSKSDSANKKVQNNENICYYDQKNIKKELEQILSKIDGAGDVEVMIVFDNSYERIVAKDSKSSVTEDSEKNTRNVDTSTVVTKKGNEQYPFVIKEIYPDVRGVLVIAEGASDAKVKSEIKNAVKTVLGVSIHKVEVLKKGG
jgi:stage III sporulation protein AG